MPNLENLRKQAKSYLRWHRARYFPVAAQIRRFVPRFHDLPDRDVLAATFKLGDAQELVARKHGFDSWAALLEGLPSMTPPTASTPRTASITAAEPQLFVADMAAACAFYVEKLGFELAFSYGEPPFYAQLGRDGGCLNLRKVAGPVFDSGFRARERDVLSCTLRGRRRQAPVPRVRQGRRGLPPALANRTLGRPHLHRSGSGRQSDLLCRGIGWFMPRSRTSTQALLDRLPLRGALPCQEIDQRAHRGQQPAP